jgi:hypothetical protein
MVVLGHIVGLETLHPLAIVVLGGLVTSTLVTLLVLPALYVHFGAGSEPVTRPERADDPGDRGDPQSRAGTETVSTELATAQSAG